MAGRFDSCSLTGLAFAGTDQGGRGAVDRSQWTGMFRVGAGNEQFHFILLKHDCHVPSDPAALFPCAAVRRPHIPLY